MSNEKTPHAIKLLVSAFEASGKSTITSTIRDAFIFNMDRKEYGFRVPHANIPEFFGMDDFITTVDSKIAAYIEKTGAYPKVVVFDTVTQFYSSMQKYNGEQYKGFDVHSNNNKDTFAFNAYVEDRLIAQGISVVIVAHTVFDEATSRHVIPAAGQFAKTGSWFSVVNDAIFIERKVGKLVVHQQSLKLPARSTLPGIKASVPVEEYDINAHIDQLLATKVEAAEYVY